MITPRTVIGARFMKAGRMYFFETRGVDALPGDRGQAVAIAHMVTTTFPRLRPVSTYRCASTIRSNG